jgi:hypothetical protein
MQAPGRWQRRQHPAQVGCQLLGVRARGEQGRPHIPQPAPALPVGTAESCRQQELTTMLHLTVEHQGLGHDGEETLGVGVHHPVRAGCCKRVDMGLHTSEFGGQRNS